MAPGSSDSDSPKSTKSNTSRSSEEEEDPKSISTAHPGSPSNAHQSSDESTTSDGVLVDLPNNPDQDAPEGGILVNIDGSIQEGREDLFVDAPEELGSARSVGLDESLAMIDYGERSLRVSLEGEEIARMRSQLEETMTECRKYKEERELFGREVVNLRLQLQEIFDQQSSPGTINEESVQQLRQMGNEEEGFMSSTPLHLMVADCSKIFSHFKGILNEQSNSEDRLNAVIHTKDLEVEDLNLKLIESNVCQDVVISYLGSVQETWSKSMKESSDEANNRLLASLESVIGQDMSSTEDFVGDGISLVQKKTLSLIEKHLQLLSETQQLRQFLAETRPELLSSDDFSYVYTAAREELLESKRKEASLLEKLSELENENRRIFEEVNKMKEGLESANAETDKAKVDLEQAENRLAAAREKLSMAVTKGKSLVQHRDALKQSLAEKTSALEKCVLELQQKSAALEALEASTEELKHLLLEKTNNLENCLHELQQKSTALESFEINSLELNRSLAEKTSELEKCLLEMQQKSEALDNTESRCEELKQSLAEKIEELDKCFVELRQKTDALENTETNGEELKRLLAEKRSDLEQCLLELQKKSNALEASEVSAEELRQALAQKTMDLENCLLKLDQIQTVESTVEELKMSLAEKVNELEKCQQELQEKSESLLTSTISSEESIHAQELVNSLKDSLSEKNRVIQEIEEVMQIADSENNLPNMEIVDRVKWFVDQKHESDAISSMINKVKDTLSSLDLPEAVSSAELDSQIGWLLESFALAKEDIIKLQDEIADCRISISSHEPELSDVQKEVDRLAASLLELKQEKEYLQSAHHDLKCKYKKIAEKLSVFSNEKDGLMKELTVPYGNTSDGQISLDTELLIENCITVISERMKTLIAVKETIEKMQTLLYIKCQEQMLCENILKEEIISKSEVISLSNELGRASSEVIALRNEKETLEKELERMEERSSLIREKLSLAVKKGKGLVQEREGFKRSLDEKNSDIEKLNQELKQQESVIAEYREQIQSLSVYQEHIQKLESEVASLNDLRGKSENLLLESNLAFQALVKSIEEISLPSGKIFGKPVDKLNGITEHIRESEVAKAHIEQELEEVKSEVTQQASRLADAFSTIDTMKDQLSTAETHISSINQEKENLQLNKVSIEEELEKLKKVSSMQDSKLEYAYATIRSLEDQVSKMNNEQEFEELKEKFSVQSSKILDANATIKSLEDSLAQASNDISKLEADKHETESKSQQQIVALNVKLADCMEALARTSSSLKNQSENFAEDLSNLKILIKDEVLFSLITEEFRKKIEGLRHMGILIQDLDDQFKAKGLQIHPGFEVPDSAKFGSLLGFEDFINDRMFNSNISTENLDGVTTFSEFVKGLQDQAKVLRNKFQGLSRYTDDHVAVISQALQVVRNEFLYMLELNESLKLTVNKLEAENQIQEAKMSSIEKETSSLLSACQDAIQDMQIELSDLSQFPEYVQVSFSMDSGSIEAVDGTQQEGSSEYAKTAEDLLLSARKIKFEAQKLMSVNKVLETSINDLNIKLKEAELSATTAIQDGLLRKERLLNVEGDFKELQKVCSEMKAKIEDNQVKEDMWSNKIEQLSSLQNAATTKDKEISETLLSEGQMEAVIDKVSGLAISFDESHINKVHFSSPMEKLIYILDNFSELQEKVDSLTYEKEDMQLILDSHAHQIEHQKRAAETIGTNYQDLESKKFDLIELTVGLEKLIQKFGGNYLSEDQKPTSAKGFLPIVERMILASYNELEELKSKMQDLGTKLQAKEQILDELSTKNKLLEDSIHSQFAQPDILKERNVFDASTAMGSGISEIEEVGPLGKNTISPPAAHARTMRKGSTDHLVLNIGSESDPLISAQEIDEKGHVFKSLNASGLIPKQGKVMADRVDGIWVSGGRILMNRPRARLGLIAYWIFLHLWLLGTIL